MWSDNGLTLPLARAREQLELYGFLPCAQIFVYGPSSYAATKTGLTEPPEGIKLITHTAYVAPLWSKNKSARTIVERELEICSKLNSDLVVHYSASFVETFDLAAESLIRADAKMTREITLFIEINSTKKSAFCAPDAINAVLDKCVALNLTRIKFGICVDTAHAWACGVPLVSREDTQEFLARIRHPVMFHLNDSREPRGSGKDEHELLTAGKIWGVYKTLPIENSGLVAILDYAATNGCPVILERVPEIVGADIELIASLGYGKKLN